MVKPLSKLIRQQALNDLVRLEQERANKLADIQNRVAKGWITEAKARTLISKHSR